MFPNQMQHEGNGKETMPFKMLFPVLGVTVTQVTYMSTKSLFNDANIVRPDVIGFCISQEKDTLV